MCGLFQCLKTTVVPYLIKTRRTHPRLIEHLSDENTPEEGPCRGTTRVPQDTGEGILSLLDTMIHDETSNLRRRDNIQLVRNFVEKHGWPQEDYVIWALKGVVLVLTEGQWRALPQSPARADAFELGGPGLDVRAALGFWAPPPPSPGDFIELRRYEDGLLRYLRYQ